MRFDFYSKGTVSMVIDGQYGSTGKGLLAGYLAVKSKMQRGHVVHTSNAAPNAGHTVVWSVPPVGLGEPGRTMRVVTYHLPTGAVMRGELAYVNAGAVVDINLLMTERQKAEQVMGHHIHTMIHPSAVILQPEDRESEMEAGSAMGAISSTRKGVGAAIARKARREADLMNKWKVYAPGVNLKVEALDLNRQLKSGMAVSVEVPQGLSLALNHGGFYPYCTGREVSVAQALADAGIHPRWLGMVALSMRTYPIRVGSLPGSTSGPYYHDQKEITWDELGQPPEMTTVTQRIRRVFTWSRQQYRDALVKTMPSLVFLNFCNYFKSVQDFGLRLASMQEDHDMVGIKPAIIYGFGPAIEDVIDDPDMATVHMDRIISERGKS